MRRRTHLLALLGDLAAELGEVGVDHLLGELRPTSESWHVRDTREVMRRRRTHSLALLGDLAAELKLRSPPGPGPY